MNINRIDHLFESKRPSSNQAETDKGFQKVFELTLTQMDTAPPSIPAAGKADVIEQGDKILNLLEDYAKELKDPSKTLRQIGPLVDRIAQEVSVMEAQSVQKVQKDPELAEIIRDLTVTANVAVLKFIRGDYI